MPFPVGGARAGAAGIGQNAVRFSRRGNRFAGGGGAKIFAFFVQIPVLFRLTMSARFSIMESQLNGTEE